MIDCKASPSLSIRLPIEAGRNVAALIMHDLTAFTRPRVTRTLGAG